ncbi:hypothetical protein PG996_008301 [Apiospora saccharicola]|uniref:Uncharacterized protein n=1 Tax=Apiospora saccharicola TaxID=335842 RepID=A0ABR1V0P9_9PEZI
MDRVFRGPETMKKPDVVRSNSGWQPRSPSDALDFMGYFHQRTRLEFSQACGPEKKFGLRHEDFERLDMCSKNLTAWYEECKAYDLFTRDQGWLYSKPYDELWNSEWRKTKNVKSNWMDTVLEPQEEDHKSASQTASSTQPAPSTNLTQSIAPEDQIKATSSAIPVAAIAVADTPVAAIPVQASALNATVVPATAMPMGPTAATTRKPLPISGAQQPDRKRRMFKPVNQTVSNGIPSCTGQADAGADVAFTIARNTSIDQSNAKPNGSKSQSKTDNEKAKGKRLLEDTEGQDATAPCKACLKAGRVCRVAIKPVDFNSMKCAHCIMYKLGDCCSTENPGYAYPQDDIDVMKARQSARIKP